MAGPSFASVTNLPAQSFTTAPNVYGTVAGGGYSDTITISIDPMFTANEVSFIGLNGNSEQSYTATGFVGMNTVFGQSKVLASNSDGGFALFDILGMGLMSVTFAPTDKTGFFDFSIDTIELNGNLTMSTVPLPASAPMFGAALLALAGLSYGMKRKGSAAHA